MNSENKKWTFLQYSHFLSCISRVTTIYSAMSCELMFDFCVITVLCWRNGTVNREETFLRKPDRLCSPPGCVTAWKDSQLTFSTNITTSTRQSVFSSRKSEVKDRPAGTITFLTTLTCPYVVLTVCTTTHHDWGFLLSIHQWQSPKNQPWWPVGAGLV